MSGYIHFSWHASTPYGQERGGWREVTHTSKDKPFSISESRDELAYYAEVRRKKTKSTDVWIYTNRTNNGETST